MAAAVGRPSKYKKEFARQAEKLCEAGFTDMELADFFEIDKATLNRWKHAHPEFRASIKTGKAPADDRVEMSLYHRAVGYSYQSEKLFHYQGDVIRAPVVEHVPPDTGACIFWLKNRRSEKWRDKPEGEGDESLSEAVNKLIDRLPC